MPSDTAPSLTQQQIRTALADLNELYRTAQQLTNPYPTLNSRPTHATLLSLHNKVRDTLAHALTEPRPTHKENSHAI